ncbi:MAG: LiaF domain-containing protein, partial [Nocardioidaceae bacterium]
IAAASMLGAGFTFTWPAVPITLVVLALFYFLAVRPYNRKRDAEAAMRAESEPTAMADPPDAVLPLDDKPPTPRPRNPRRDHGALFGLTFAVTVVVLGAMWIASETSEHIGWPYFPLAAFLVVAAGMLVGTVLGNGRPLVLLAVPLALVLLATTVLPTYTIGDDRTYPAYASDVESSYQQGIGNFVLDLTDVRDPGALDGRTVTIDQGVGSLEVVVPDGVDVDVDAQTDAGNLIILGETSNGAPVSRHYVDPTSGDPDLRLDLSQTTGEIRVTRP